MRPGCQVLRGARTTPGTAWLNRWRSSVMQVKTMLALFCLAAGADFARAGGVELSVDRPRCWGGEKMSVHVASSGAEPLLWETSVAGAPIERGEILVPEDGRTVLLVRVPQVERRVLMTVRVQPADFGELSRAAPRSPSKSQTASCAVRVFPAYDGSRLKRLFASASVGVAEAREEISSCLARFDRRYEKTGGRLALELFEGDVLVASGVWWASEAGTLESLLNGHLRRGVRIVIVEGGGPGPYFATVPWRRIPTEPDLLVVDPQHGLGDRLLLEGWPGAIPFALASGPVNYRRVVVGMSSDRPIAVEVFPPEGGAILRVSLPLLSRFDRDPAAPILFERCVEWALGIETPEWKQVAFRLGEAEGLRERLDALGVRELGVTGKDALPQDHDGLLLITVDELGEEVREWISSGGRAVVLIPGSREAPAAEVADDPVTRGISLALARRLYSRPSDEDAWDAIDLEGERRALVAGLLDEIRLGNGKAWVLRVGPPDEEMTQPWREFLAQVFTNLGVRLVEGEEEVGRGGRR